MTREQKTQMIKELMIEAFDAKLSLDVHYYEGYPSSLDIMYLDKDTDKWVIKKVTNLEYQNEQEFMDEYNELKRFINNNKTK